MSTAFKVGLAPPPACIDLTELIVQATVHDSDSEGTFAETQDVDDYDLENETSATNNLRGPGMPHSTHAKTHRHTDTQTQTQTHRHRHRPH